MYARVVRFDGPRSPELVAASERAGRERLEPAIAADPVAGPAHAGTIVLRQPDGTELVVALFDSEQALRRSDEITRSAPLLPGEDPALLPGADHVDDFRVVYASVRALRETGVPA